MTSDRVNTFHDAWTKQEMTDPADPGGLHAAGGQGDQGQSRGRLAEHLSDRQPGICRRPRQEFGAGLSRPAQAGRDPETDRRGFRQNRQADRRRQAEARLQELRRDHADRQQALMTLRRAGPAERAASGTAVLTMAVSEPELAVAGLERGDGTALSSCSNHIRSRIRVAAEPARTPPGSGVSELERPRIG